MLILGCKNSVIPLSVTGIGDYAFCGCGGLTSIKIPPSARSVGSYSFSGCGELKSIGIPSLVTNIGAYAFSNCNKLKTVYYGADGAAWNAVSIGGYDNVNAIGNDSLMKATRYYYSETYLSGNYWRYVNGVPAKW
jgi:hypothetical protein